MKLSEAIKLGSRMKPQGFGALEDEHGTCAMGAALDACGCLYTLAANLSYVLWPWLSGFARCPVCRHDECIGYVITAHLNDRHEWTREKIADWVASIEPSESPEVPETQEEMEKKAVSK